MTEESPETKKLKEDFEAGLQELKDNLSSREVVDRLTRDIVCLVAKTVKKHDTNGDLKEEMMRAVAEIYEGYYEEEKMINWAEVLRRIIQEKRWCH